MKTFYWSSHDRNWNQQDIENLIFFINTASGWIGQLQKRKHLTRGKINENGWKLRMGSWFVPYVQNTKKNFQDFWQLQMPL